jgi:hypothetical protein
MYNLGSLGHCHIGDMSGGIVHILESENVRIEHQNVLIRNQVGVYHNDTAF